MAWLGTNTTTNEVCDVGIEYLRKTNGVFVKVLLRNVLEPHLEVEYTCIMRSTISMSTWYVQNVLFIFCMNG